MQAGLRAQGPADVTGQALWASARQHLGSWTHAEDSMLSLPAQESWHPPQYGVGQGCEVLGYALPQQSQRPSRRDMLGPAGACFAEPASWGASALGACRGALLLCPAAWCGAGLCRGRLCPGELACRGLLAAGKRLCCAPGRCRCWMASETSSSFTVLWPGFPAAAAPCVR